jgi:hypothetical protein
VVAEANLAYALFRMGWTIPPEWRERRDWVAPDTPLGKLLRAARWVAVLSFSAFLIQNWHAHGLPFDRNRLLLSLVVWLAAASIGRHPAWLVWVLIDFVPFAAVLMAYDYLRGLSDTAGMPTWWHPQIAVDRFLFFGHVPTVWLQERLKHRPGDIRWYDLIVCVTYVSFYFLPYVTAAVIWLRSRADFQRWSLRFVGLSFLSFALFVLAPSAPPWAAALCRPGDVADHPNDPSCLHGHAEAVVGNLLGPFHSHVAGAHPYVERIAAEGFDKLHLGVAHSLWSTGINAADAVAAVPSLHVGGTVLFCLFMWGRLRPAWRPLLVAYPIVMLFTLTYGGEHYVIDGFAGALFAWFVHTLATRLERRHVLAAALQAVQRPERVKRREAGQNSDGVPAPAG